MSEKKKLSWREIDKLKDASGLAKLRRKLEKREGTTPTEDKKLKERYLKELDKLFHKRDVEKEEWLKKLHQAVGKKDFQKIALLFYEKFGLPEEGRDLIPFFDVEAREIVLKVLEKIKENFAKFSYTEKQAILAKLKAINLSTKDEFLAYKSEKLLKELTL